jgi:phage tail sheath protein FI
MPAKTFFDPVNDTDDTFENLTAANTEMWRQVCYKMIDLASKVRKDCMVILNTPRSLVLEGNQKVLRPSRPSRTFSNTIGQKLYLFTGLNSSYAALYTNWFKIIDDFTGQPCWIPESIKAAGVYCRTDKMANMWDAPAGLNRGVLSGVVDIAFNPSTKEADQLYIKSLNYAVKYPLDGYVIEGQKTTQVKPSAFDRVNVRRLFLRLERMVYQVSRYFVYEPNNIFTRRRFVSTITPIFKSIKANGGLYDFLIVCDESNNTPEVIDNNELRCAILLKPVRTAEFILVDFVATRTDANFREVLDEIL